MACTMRLASETARLGQPEVKLGLMPGYGGTQRLPRLVGRSAALRLLLTGEMIGAAEALRIGLVDEVVPAERLMERAGELARSIAAMAPLAVAGCMEAVERGGELGLEDALKVEAEIFGRLSGTADKAEGTAAFLDKRRRSGRVDRNRENVAFNRFSRGVPLDMLMFVRTSRSISPLALFPALLLPMIASPAAPGRRLRAKPRCGRLLPSSRRRRPRPGSRWRRFRCPRRRSTWRSRA